MQESLGVASSPPKESARIPFGLTAHRAGTQQASAHLQQQQASIAKGAEVHGSVSKIGERIETRESCEDKQ
jgi:hypothetical protein